MADEADRLLHEMLGPDVDFRSGQREAIDALVRDRGRALVVQRTGWGKSLVYWIATKLLRDQGGGPTLLVSPLLALMRDQIAMAERIGVRARTINSSNRADWTEIEREIAADEVDVLLISPERLGNADFISRILPAFEKSIGLLVIDEAHCISDWGHDFRPDYRRISRVLGFIPAGTPVLATTATANDRVIDDLREQLGSNVPVLVGPLARDSLELRVLRLNDPAERLAWLAEWVPRFKRSGIVYCLTIRDTETVARWLRSKGIDAREYHGGLDPERREELEGALKGDTVHCLVATVALGMGFDKPDLEFVIHYQRPQSVIAYYQQVGRAGRSLDRAVAVVMSGREDDDIAEYFIESAFPPAADMLDVLRVLDGVTSASVRQLEVRLNQSHGMIEKALKLLEVDSAVAVEKAQYFRTPNAWAPDIARIERVTQLRRDELKQMQDYVAFDGCLMQFITSALDDPTSHPCGRCESEGGRPLPREIDADLVLDAQRFLRRTSLPIDPRKRWPAGAVRELSGTIDPVPERGFALAGWRDAGWGRLIEEGKKVTHRFDDQLVEAAALLIENDWRPDPVPTWVAPIPSARNPGLVGDFAARLADRLRLPLHDVLAASGTADPQKSMANSAQQVHNVHASIRVVKPVPSGPVLLVDDLVDSRWTLTYAGWLLRKHGSGPVHPFALGDTSGRSRE